MKYIVLGIVLVVFYYLLRNAMRNQSIDVEENDYENNNSRRSMRRSIKKCGRSTLFTEAYSNINNTNSSSTSSSGSSGREKEGSKVEDYVDCEYCDILEDGGRYYIVKNGKVIKDITDEMEDVEVVELDEIIVGYHINIVA